MEFVAKKHLIYHVSKALPPIQTNPNDYVTNIPIIVIIVVGMIATSLLLMAYYTFVIKCCLNWNNIDLVRVTRLSLSRQNEEQSSSYSITSESRGLDQVVIQSIPIIHYKKEKNYVDERISSECAFCLNEFQQNEKLRVIPNCNHVFHIDCVDVWLQNNASCPLCRRRVSLTREVEVEHVLTPRPSPYFHQSQNFENIIGGCEDFVVIDLDGSARLDASNNNENDEGQNRNERREERGKEFEVIRDSISPNSHKKSIKLHKVNSMGNECIIKNNIQPNRRSFSMDLSIHNSLNNLHVHEVNSIEVCGNK